MRCFVTFGMSLTSPLVYTCVFVAILETACDCFESYYITVEGWGDSLVIFRPYAANKAASAFSNITSTFDVLRELDGLQPRWMPIIISLSCSLCAGLLHLEDSELLCGCMWTKSKVICGCHLSFHYPGEYCCINLPLLRVTSHNNLLFLERRAYALLHQLFSWLRCANFISIPNSGSIEGCYYL